MSAERPATEAETRPPRWAFLACAVLVGVAVLQIATALSTDLTAWKGGGFGMFATAETGGNRQIRAYAVFDAREQRLALPQGRLRRALLNYPTEERLGAYANALAARHEKRLPGLRAIRVEMWRAAFDPETRVYRIEPWHEYLLELSPE
jgi:hypothetical protein